jgi:hypothetical protein
MKTRDLFCASAAAWLALAAGAARAQQAIPASGVPVEFSVDLDRRAIVGGGALSVLDPGQALYVEPADASGPPYPRDAIDYAPALEDGDEPDEQVDALASVYDAQFEQVIANTAELFLSFRPDPPGPSGATVFREFSSGSTQAVWHKPHLQNPNQGASGFENLDALEMWGPIGSDDALFYSLNGDVTGTSVFVRVGGVGQPYLSQAQITAAVTLLFVAAPQNVDVDALMVRDADGNAAWSAGDAVLFSLRASPGVDGGEIVYWEFGAAATFLNHGGHLWNTGFNVMQAFGVPAGSEDVDALEAAPPGQVAAPATPIPILGLAGAALLGAGLLAAGCRALPRR